MRNLAHNCGGSAREFRAIDTSGRVETRKLGCGIVDRLLPQYVLRTYFIQKDEAPGGWMNLYSLQLAAGTKLLGFP
ncbi:MAG: hypothetical protein ACXW6T_16450, partial [Candidatus Binatia bacterium]